MATSIYIHIPFCRQKCFYCSFISYTTPEFIDEYLKALHTEICNVYQQEQLKTVYIGGGTPSILTSRQIYEILKPFNIKSTTEITIELNPEYLTKQYFRELKSIGINRLSFGCQSFDTKILQSIGRRHTPQEVEFAIKTAQDNGFNNISVDFIYGLPNQNLTSFTSDLVRAKNFNIQHISLYGLKIEEGCYFYDKPPANIADENQQADMYLAAIDTLKPFEHYEISNFAIQGYQSRHNLNYWNNKDYYGFGVAAHGYLNGERYSNKTTLNNYFKNPLEKAYQHKLTKQEILEEEIFLGFRRTSGIDTSQINEKFKIDFDKKYSKILDKYSYSKHLEKTNTGWKLTTDGILVSNVILSEFLD